MLHITKYKLIKDFMKRRQSVILSIFTQRRGKNKTNFDAIFRCGSRTEERNGEKLKNSKADQPRNNKDKVRF